MRAIVIAAIFSMIGCGRAASPADSIALGQTHPCGDAGAWDGLECAKPHVQQADDTPSDHPPPAKTKPRKPTVMPPPSQSGECDCEPGDALCDCDGE